MYIRRDWKTDESIMEKMLNHYAIIQNESELPNNFQLILFPEGTNLTPETRKKSNAFAAQNNLKPLNHLLHPRTTGFSYIANKMRDSK
jgi:lysocardiolipin and lysophospholipid acyltransferase